VDPDLSFIFTEVDSKYRKFDNPDIVFYKGAHFGAGIAILLLESKLSDTNHPVWLAFELESERDVVLKFVADRKSAIRERNLMNDVDHPNIVKLLRIFSAGTYTVLVLEYKKGESLLHIWEQLTPDRGFEVLLDVGSALSAIHEAGLWHGDVSHLNVIYQKEKRAAYLIDFSFEGKCAVGFQAPEDFEGNPYAVDSATDVYRFGKLIDLLRPDLTHHFSDCFRENPSTRPSMRTVNRRLERKKSLFLGTKGYGILTLTALFLCVGMITWLVSRSENVTTINRLLRLDKNLPKTGDQIPPNKESGLDYLGEPIRPNNHQPPLLLYIIQDQPF
jgi:serine/threonine protein kinase